METMQIVPESRGISGPDKPQTPKDKALEELPLISGSGPQENGVRVSVTTPEVDAEISIKRIFGEGSEDVSFGDKEEPVSCAITKESDKEGSDSVLGVNDNKRNVDGKMAPKDAPLGLSGDASSGRVDCHDNGISLVVEVHGSSPSKEGHSSKFDSKKGQNLGKKCVYGDNAGSFHENEGNRGEKSKEMDGSNPKLLRHKNGDVDEDMDSGEYQYSVGEFVWGKIKSHPWWPGRIYDPKDASKDAAKYSQRDRLLVAYFGDSTFAWCYPYQLKPFEENFIEMSKQSNSRSFVKAVEEAVVEIGRWVENTMTCSCAPKETKIGLSRPLTVNAGVKEEAVVPEGGTEKFSVAHFEPPKFLSGLKCIAQVVSVRSRLELLVLKSQLSAFCRAKGPFHQLAVYHEPQEIAGLEEEVGNGVTKSCDIGAPVEVPIQGPVEEDWLSMPISPSFGKSSQSLLHKASGSEDKLYQRRKQKSMAEIMGGNSDAEPKNEEADMMKEDINSVKSDTSSVKRRRKKGGNEAENHVVDSNLTSARGRRKKTKLSGSPVTSEDRAGNVESDSEGKGESENSPVSREGKKKGLTVENEGVKLPQESEHTSASRERKKSKYLCPPYTNVVRMNRNSGTMGDPKTESHEVSNLAGKAERNSRAAGQSIGSSTISKSGGDMAFQNNDGKELQTPRKKRNKVIDLKEISMSLQEVVCGIQSAALNPLYLRENKSQEKICGFLSAFRSAVYHDGSDYKMFNKHEPDRKRKRQESEPGSSGEDLKRNCQDSSFKQALTDRKKKKTAHSDGPELKPAAAGTGMSDIKTKHKKKGKKVKSAKLFLSFGPGISLPSKDDLVKIFSKFGTLIESETEILYDSFCARVVFSRSSDAEMAFNSSQKASPFGAAQVTYRLRYPSSSASDTTWKTPDKEHDCSNEKAGDGEGPVVDSSASAGGEKFSRKTPDKKHGCSNKKAGAGKATVVGSSASAAGEGEKSPDKKHDSLKKKGGAGEAAVVNSSASGGGGGGEGGEKSQLHFIKQKLEMMTCMLEKSSGKMSGEMKSNLEGEMKGLLEQVSTMAETSSL